MLEDLRTRLEDYFGSINGIKQGLKPEKPLVKPPELEVYEMLKETGLPLVAGGLVDQPVIWMEQYGVIRNVIFQFAELERRNQEAKRKQERRNA